MERIDSASNKKLKLIGKLHNSKFRREEGLFVAEGVRLVEMAAASCWKKNIHFVIVTDDAYEEERVKKIVDRLQENECPVYLISKELYKKVSTTVSPQGVLAVIREKLLKSDQICRILDMDNPLIAVLDGVQDPGNAGTVIRTADAAGFSAVVFLENTVDVLGDKVVRSSMGSLFNIPILTGINGEFFANKCKSAGVKLFVTALDERAVSHFEADYKEPVAMVFGNEGNGASKALLDLADRKIYIPMDGKAESLNVSVAAAIVIYEAYRQRH